MRWLQWKKGDVSIPVDPKASLVWKLPTDSQPRPYTSFITCMFNYPILNIIFSETYSLKTLKSLSILLRDEAAAFRDNQTMQRIIRKRYLMILHLATMLFRTHHRNGGDVAQSQSCHICGRSDEINKYHYSEHITSDLYNKNHVCKCKVCGSRSSVRTEQL